MYMKTLVFLFLLLPSLVLSQDFKLVTITSTGAQIGKDLDPNLVNATIQVTPTFQWEAFKAAAVTMTYTTSKETGFLAGSRLGYSFLRNEDLELGVTGQALFGNEGKQLYGGGLEAIFDRVSLSGNIGYETTQEKVWVDMGIGYYIVY